MGHIRWQVIREPDPGRDVIEAWDRLAVERACPYCAPGWMLSWGLFQNGGAHLRIGIVREDDRIIGIVPLIGRSLPPGGGVRYELLSSGTGYRIEPLAAGGRQREVARAAGEMLASLSPRLGVLSLHGIDSESGWSEALASAFGDGGGARVLRQVSLHAPILSLEGARDFEGWLASKTRHFRKRAAADRRKFMRIGELELASTPAQLERAIAAFVELHLGRWRSLGGSNLDYPSMPARLLAAAERLGPERIRASTAIVDGRIVAVDIFVRAGSATAAWNGGWLEDYRELRPAWLTLLNGIGDAVGSGVTEVDLGPGAHPWKERLATRDAAVVSDQVIPRSMRSLPTYLFLLPERLREAARRRPAPAPAAGGGT